MVSTNNNKIFERAKKMANICSWVWHTGTNELEISDETYQIFGLNKEDVVNPYVLNAKIVHPDDRKKLKDTISTTLKDGISYSLDYRIIRTDNGEQRYVNLETDIDKIPNSKNIIVYGFIQDITDRKKAEDALRDKTEMINAIVDTSQEWIWAINLQGIHTYSNPAIKHILGYPPDKLVGKPSFNLMHKNDRQMIATKLPLWISKKSGWKSLVIRWKHRNGSWRYLESNAVPIIDTNGEIAGFRGVDRDITERKQAEEALIDSKERLKILFESAPDAYYLTDLKGVFLDGNRTAEDILGYKRVELIGTNFLKLKLLSAKDILRASKLLLKNVQGKSTGPDEFILNRKDDSQTTVEILTHPVKIQNKTMVLGIARDISERKLAEKYLKDSEEKHRTYVESAPEGIFVVDTDGNYVDVNPAACQMIGYSREELLDMSIPELASPVAPIETLESFDELKKMAKNQSEVLLRRKNGTDFPALLTSVALSDNRFMAFCSDITERKQTEKRIKESEERFKQLSENAQEWIWEVDLNGLYTYSSETTEKILGYTNEEIVAKKHFYDFFLTEDQKDLKKAAFEAFNQKLPFRDFINRNIAKNGEIRWLSTNGVPIFDNNNNLIGYRGSDIDITVRKNAEIALKANEEKFSSLVNNSPDIIMRIDSEGVINYINYDYANQKPEEILGKSIYKYLPSDFHEVARSTIDKVFETGKSFSFENLSVNSTDEVLWYKNNIAAISKDGEVNAATIIATNITELKQAEIMQTEFIASISHELRTPLTTIRESLSLLADKLFGELNSDQLDIVNPCMDDVDRIGRILNNLLSISNIESHSIKLERKMVDIAKLAKSTMSSFENQATSKNIEFVLSLSNKPLNLYLDRDRIIQVLMNLIGNAIKYTKEGKIEIIITENEDFVVCCIKDTGLGIEQKDLGTLFDRLHQVGKIMRSGEKGSGIGLSVVKGIVKSHKGKVWVNSTINKGSKFFFSLPKYSTDEIITENIENEIKKISGKNIKRSLLLVRLDNYSEIESKLGVEKADKVTKLIHQIIQNKLAPGEFSFIKEKDEVILFSDVPKQNINILTSKLEDMLAISALKIDKDLTIDLSYSRSIYPDNGDNADELIQSAYKAFLKNDKN